MFHHLSPSLHLSHHISLSFSSSLCISLGSTQFLAKHLWVYYKVFVHYNFRVHSYELLNSLIGCRYYWFFKSLPLTGILDFLCMLMMNVNLTDRFVRNVTLQLWRSRFLCSHMLRTYLRIWSWINTSYINNVSVQ